MSPTPTVKVMKGISQHAISAGQKPNISNGSAEPSPAKNAIRPRRQPQARTTRCATLVSFTGDVRTSGAARSAKAGLSLGRRWTADWKMTVAQDGPPPVLALRPACRWLDPDHDRSAAVAAGEDRRRGSPIQTALALVPARRAPALAQSAS